MIVALQGHLLYLFFIFVISFVSLCAYSIFDPAHEKRGFPVCGSSNANVQSPIWTTDMSFFA